MNKPVKMKGKFEQENYFNGIFIGIPWVWIIKKSILRK